MFYQSRGGDTIWSGGDTFWGHVAGNLSHWHCMPPAIAPGIDYSTNTTTKYDQHQPIDLSRAPYVLYGDNNVDPVADPVALALCTVHCAWCVHSMRLWTMQVDELLDLGVVRRMLCMGLHILAQYPLKPPSTTNLKLLDLSRAPYVL